jgi:glutamate dehydrogenase
MTQPDPAPTPEASFQVEPLRAALAHLSPGRVDLVARLAVAAYRRAQVERLRDVGGAAALFADALTFLDRRRPGALALRVFDPTEAEHGWTAEGTVVEVNGEDHPFLLSTVTEELARQGHEPAEVVHPVIGVERAGDGHVVAITAARGAACRESFIHVELSRKLDGSALEPLADDLRRVLGDAHAATRDFPAMRERVAEVRERTLATAGLRYPQEEVDEAAALLGWLLDDHFVLLGSRSYAVSDIDGRPHAHVDDGSGLGILVDTSTSTYAAPVPLEEISEPLRSRIVGGALLTVARTNRRSTVHRQVPMVYVGVKRVAPGGQVRGEDRFLGLFAQKAFAEPASSIPVLRHKLRQIIEREDVVEHSYDERALRTLFEAFPKHELFAVSTDDLRRTLVALLETQKRQNVRVLFHTDERGFGVSVLVSLPRERFNAALRKRLQRLLVERFGAGGVDYHLSITERDQALLHFQLHVDQRAVAGVAVEALEREVVALTRTWDDRLRDALVQAKGALDGARLATRWAARLPAGYQATTRPDTAVADITEIETMLATGGESSIVLQRDGGPPPAGLRFKLYRRGQGVELSSFLPILESLGFVVVEVVPHDFEVTAADGTLVVVHLHDFGVRLPGRTTLDPGKDGARLAAAARALWHGSAEADSLNRLVLLAGLEWDDVAVLRAYRRYRRQVGTSFTEAYQDEALVQHPEFARDLVALFAAHFDPDLDAGQAEVAAARERVSGALEAVERLDQDRILRGFLGMVEATTRTNRYVERGSPALALKIDSAQVPDVPKPVPYAETFVYSPEIEGVHLRGGPVARGGIRWSDRREDFRAEVLGLMKAQMVKNAVIVPAGAKGGFVVKQPPAEGQSLPADVQRLYGTFVRALLDLTGNVVGHEVVPPPRVRRRDGDDPYLVVAPDRGTATFSDLANTISEEYGFWLGDAFASGGSSGYDHKAMGITARGAWIAVQRHFRELGLDVQTDPIRVVGVGDMSGDVFGNGLLQSRAVKLVAAFDHRHVFVDPDPDPEVSWQERKRLFDAPRSSWDDYDRTRLSPGGGVWPRSVKAIGLSPEAQAVLRLDSSRHSPPDVIKAILRAPVDLLFAGGVGTFVKAGSESHADVGDRSNEGLRIDATELGARVIGEGANLALTQRARIQYSRRGGRCNTDAIDNAAGVDTSDREVNLKILLRLAVEEGVLDASRRDELLASVTDDVAAAALRNVYLQTWRLSQEVADSPGMIELYEQLMTDLERVSGAEEPSAGRMVAGRLDRAVEALPTSAEMRRRREAGAGMTRPELAVLLAYAKVDLRTKLLASGLLGDPTLRHALAGYFPRAVAERFPRLLDRHRLRGELVATVVAGDMIDRMGITYTSRMCREFGVPAPQVAAAYCAAREVADARRHWRDIERLDEETDPELQLELKAEVDGLVDAFVRAYLRQGAAGSIATTVERDQPVFGELTKVVPELGSTDARARRRARVSHYTGLGVDDELAERIVSLGDLAMVPDVAEVGRRSGAEVRHVAELFTHLSEVLPFEKLYLRLSEIEPASRWERWQQRGLLDELRQVRRDAAVRILAEAGRHSVEWAVSAFLDARAVGGDRWRAMVGALDADAEAGLAAVAVVVRVLREVLATEPRG